VPVQRPPLLGQAQACAAAIELVGPGVQQAALAQAADQARHLGLVAAEVRHPTAFGNSSSAGTSTKSLTT
jgi:hypothetical protein